MKWISLPTIALAATIGAAMATAQDRVARGGLPNRPRPPGASVSQAQTAIDRAAAAGKYVFIFFYSGQDCTPPP